MDKQKKLSCLVCASSTGKGMEIMGHFLCFRCEGQIVKTPVGENRYPQLLKKIKIIWSAVLDS